MWSHVIGGADKPSELDTTSSKKWNYVRKNFVYVEAEENDDTTIPAHWEWEEMKISKGDWDVFQQVQANIDYLAMMLDIEL